MTGNFGERAPKRLHKADFPVELLDLPRPPDEAFLWGRLPPRPRVGIVGSRRVSARGLSIAREVARELASLGICVVSGGAVGIDAAAHEGALDVGGSTLVVGPVWLERAYPVENRSLFARVLAKGGGYLTVCGRQAEPLRPFFHRRNAALVALCECLIIGECGPQSGALNAAAVARRLARPRFVLPWEIELRSTLGSQLELHGRGATAYFRKKQILDLLGTHALESESWARTRVDLECSRGDAVAKEAAAEVGHGIERVASGPVAPGGSGPPEKQRIVSLLRLGPRTIDELCSRAQLSAEVVQHHVLLLLLEGVVSESAGVVSLRE